MKTFSRILSVAVLTAALSACGAIPKQPQPVTVKTDKWSQIQSEPVEEPIQEIRAARPALKPLGDYSSDPVPNVAVGPFSAADMNLLELMDKMTAAAGVGMLFDGTLNQKTVGYFEAKPVPLKKALEAIGEQSNLWWRFKDGKVRFAATRDFALSAPRVGIILDELNQSLKDLGATNVRLDKATGNLAFRADPESYERIRRFVDEYARRREVIENDIILAEVTFNHSNKRGVDWSSIQQTLMLNWAGPKWQGTSTSNTSSTSAGTGTGSVAGAAAEAAGVAYQTLGRAGIGYLKLPISVVSNILLDQLDTQGEVSVVQQPKLTSVSGEPSAMEIKETRQYPGASNNAIGGAGATTLTSTATQIEKIDTGLKLKITSDFADGILLISFDMDYSDFLGWDSFTLANGSTQKLPHTVARTYSDKVYLKPGEQAVIGGIIRNSTDSGSSGPLGQSTQTTAARQRSELVMVIRPKIVRYVFE